MNIGNLLRNTSQNKMDKYIQNTDTGNIYKVMPTHLLQLSPWNDGDDRRVYEVEDGKYHVITYQNACMIVNKQFKDIDETWERNNKKYIARKSSNLSTDEKTAIVSMLPSHKVQKQMANTLYQLNEGQQLSIQNETLELKMIRYNGKIHYVLLINEYLPRVQLYNTFGKFCKWANIKNINQYSAKQTRNIYKFIKNDFIIRKIKRTTKF